MKEWKLTDGASHCPSCEAAAGQRHPMAEWEAAGIFPMSEKLFCSTFCKCELVDTDEAEFGDLGDIPVRDRI